ncbi:MAG: hypothetical protein JWN04_2186 [Myxococcaceae bacterium]|nr:hypothetical protein [Myxococcaceae bacterium]
MFTTEVYKLGGCRRALMCLAIAMLIACDDPAGSSSAGVDGGRVDASSAMPAPSDASLVDGGGRGDVLGVTDASVTDQLDAAPSDGGGPASEIDAARTGDAGRGFRLSLSSLVQVSRNGASIPLRVTADVPLEPRDDGTTLTLRGDGALNEMAHDDGTCTFESTDPGTLHVEGVLRAGVLRLSLTLTTLPTEHEQCPAEVPVSCTDGVCHGWASGFTAAHTHSLGSVQTTYAIEAWEQLSSRVFHKTYADTYTLAKTSFSDVSELELRQEL